MRNNMVTFEKMNVNFIIIGDDHILEFDELMDATTEYFEEGGDDYKFLTEALSVRHNEIMEEGGYHDDPFRKTHREHYVREGFFDAFGTYPN